MEDFKAEEKYDCNVHDKMIKNGDLVLRSKCYFYITKILIMIYENGVEY